MKQFSTRRDFIRDILLLAGGGVAAGAARPFPSLPASSTVGSATAIRRGGRRYVNIAPEAGIRFVHNNGAFGKKYLPETMGSGCAFVDYDNDGKQDILLVNGTDFPGDAGRQTTMKLYHNDGNDRFTDVTARAHLNVPMYGMGVAVGDYDNDGWDDIYVTALGEAHLYHNQRDGTFRDVTQHAGVNNTGFGTSAAWFDYDRDGKLDLFVCNYVQWSEKTDIYCSLDGRHKSYCTPEAYNGESCRLFHNLGSGRFEDVTRKAGIYDPTGKNMGVAIIDYDMDGWPDIAVSDDTEPNKLYHNNRNGTFTQDSIQAGIAYDSNGVARGAMGIAAADFDRSGYPSLAIGNFSNQMLGLYHNEKHDFFIDIAPLSSIGQASRLSLTFGLFFYDYDLDGLEDLFVANGHIEPDIARIQPQVTYAERPLVFHNDGRSHFNEVGRTLGFTQQIVARGAAYADINNDGYLDVLVTTNNGPAYLFKNEGADTANSIRIKTVGTRSNRDGIGAVVRVRAANGLQWQRMHSGSSYCSQSELTLTFGLAHAVEAEAVEIEWPSGEHDSLNHLKANATYVVQEGGTILSRKPFRR